MNPARVRATLLALIALVALASRPASAGPSRPERLPLREGTVYTYVVANPAGDEEHVATLSRLDADWATFDVELRLVEDSREDMRRTRRVRREDLRSSHRINGWFQAGDPEAIPGSTLMHLSAAAFEDLQRTGTSAMVFAHVPGYRGLGDSVFGSVPSGRKYYRGALLRRGDGTMPVLVNGTRVLLPVIEASGRFTVGGDAMEEHGWWLADADNAVLLRARHARLVRVDLPDSRPPASVLASELDSGDCRVQLDGIYFETGSANLLAPSQPALAAVVRLLSQHPSWVLEIEGHTDNVGGGGYNQALSQRRAAAVRDALTRQSSVDGARLVARGFGASRPVSNNATLIGRAANRRVELARSCPGQ